MRHSIQYVASLHGVSAAAKSSGETKSFRARAVSHAAPRRASIDADPPATVTVAERAFRYTRSSDTASSAVAAAAVEIMKVGKGALIELRMEADAVPME